MPNQDHQIVGNDRTKELVYGAGAQVHPITGLVIECGSGAHDPDTQARLVHLPEIARTKGPAAADAMRLKLDAAKLGPLKLVVGSESAGG